MPRRLSFVLSSFTFLVLAACAQGNPSEAASAANTKVPASILAQMTAEAGCTGSPKARLILEPGAVTQIELGADHPAYVVDAGKVRCSIPTNTPEAGSVSLALWTGPETALTQIDQFFPALSWKAANGALEGIADPAYCDDAIMDNHGNYAAGACTFSVRWDKAESALSARYFWNPKGKAPPQLVPIAIPAAFAADAASVAGCKDYNGSTEVALPGFVMETDVTGDGTPDTILDYAHLRCAVGSPGLCGTGGCTIQILVADKQATREAFNDQVLQWRVPKPGAIDLMVHGGLCGLTGSSDCTTALVWNTEKRAFDGTTRPVAYGGGAPPATTP
jgi:hypothetical protein